MEAFAIETARRNEPRTGHDVEDKESLDMKVMEYLSEQPFDSTAYEPERQSTAAPKAQNIVGPDDTTDAERLADPGNSLNINGPSESEAKQARSNWTDKVNSFLAQQDNTEAAKYNLPTQYENFAGREQDLRRIHETLSSPARICVLTGVSGIGKTATAVEYAYRLDIDYSYVFWVEAETPGLLADKYAKIATALHLDRDGVQNDNSLVFRVREALLKLEKKWLLIFDNAVAWADINPYVTKALMLSKGSVLITTREHPLDSAPKWLNQRRVELGPLSTEHGQEFLLKSIHPRLHKEALEDDEDFELAADIVKILDGLPLAISMVVGYVKESRCTLSDFLEMWEEKESRSRKPRKTSMSSGENVNTTVDSLWDIGIREVPSNSRKLLNILAFLSPDRIPKTLLVGDHEEDYLELLNSSEMKSYNRMINKLKSRRLIAVKEGADGQIEYSIHRLLKDKIMFDMDDYSIADAFRKTFRLIRKKFPSADPQQVPNPTNWSTCQEYMPHIDTFHQVFTMEQGRILPISAVSHLELAELFYDAGFHVWSRRGTLYDGLNLLRTAISLLDRIEYDRDSKLRADINCMVGLLMLEMGCKDRIQGTDHLLEVRRIRAVIYQQHPDHHDSDVLRMNAISDYALCLMNYHRFNEAGEDMLKCYKRYQEWGTIDDNPFENSKHFGNYSIVLMFQGKMADAIDSVTRCLELTERFSGKNAQWYRRLFLLASIHLQAGDLQKALALHLEILEARLKQDGKHDANFLLSLYAVGAMYHHLNNVDEATVYMKQCVDCAMNSRWSTEGLARAELHLAMLYDKLGIEEEQSRTLKEKARKVLEQNKGFAEECVQDSEDELMIFDDLQPTLLGRYTGTTLLKRLQEKLRRS
ncbi:hypothetical protein K4K49_004321 [Colletotrichum sp. SAR 10_70]|nr:hypothetical protein K4K50_003435 [Colletotrichum sp. SAR 10_71]KAI8171292.1 hypothetical protein K4K49_004321 [Colletotrichum sp. SAR 10_70]